MKSSNAKNINEEKEDKILIESAELASSKAMRTSTALGLTVKVIRDGKIISINSDKTEIVLRTLGKPKIDRPLAKGMILHKK